MDQIVVGRVRREPTIDIVRLRDIELSRASDSVVLEYVSQHGFVVVSHDVNSMRATALTRIENRQMMSGLLLVHQRTPVLQAIEDLILTGVASEVEDWFGQIQFLPL